MYRCLIALVLVLAGSCAHKAPKSLPKSGDPPSGAQADVLFYGLVAFVPEAQNVDAVFLNPGGAETHTPLLVVDVANLPNKPVSDPDYIVPAPDGRGLGVWKFSKIDFENVDGTLEQHDTPLDQPGDDLYTRMGWVPSMQEIFGTPQTVDSASKNAAAATATLTAGTLYSVFHTRNTEEELWTIGDRKDKALADGVRLRAALKNPGKALIVKLDGNRQVLVKGGSTVVVGCFPKTPPKSDEGLKHFKHFYHLRVGGPTGPDPQGPGGPSSFPTRCAPVKFP